MDILNLGAGNRVIGGAVNHDFTPHRPEIRSVHDLNRLPWPWPDNSYDLIVARSVLEHLVPDLVKTLDECWRILRPGGHVFVKLPFWNSDLAHQDPTHRWFFSLHSLDQFDPDTRRGQDYAFYTPRKWQIKEPPVLNKSLSSIVARLWVRK